ncbi:hypothetical protein [Streptomyces sp. R44]|uniref:CYTH domain-containing protein n=1 Tax=Streptomyces sp. R44 TaxID=3238633 RepID=A0AB39SSR1_9ACTN
MDILEWNEFARFSDMCRSKGMDLLPVEIKVNVEGDVPGALTTLDGSHGALMRRRIWFAEDRDGVAEGRVRLLEGGVIVRFRAGGGRDDLVVKLRPTSREKLVGRFSDAFEVEPVTYKIEEDWSRNTRVLAASLTHVHPSGTLAAAVEGGGDPAVPIDALQDQFLHACAPTVHIGGLVALGPIVSMKIDDVPLDDLEVGLEVWSAAGMEFLEVSTRVKPEHGEDAEEFRERAERKLRKLEEAVLDRGVTPAGHPDSKTSRVLTALAQAAHV